MNLTIELQRGTDEYGQEEWTAIVEPPLNDGGPYIHWPSAAAVLSAIADDIGGVGE